MTARYRQGPAVLDVEDRISAAGARLPTGWVTQAKHVVQTFGTARLEFTIADLREAGLPEPPSSAHWGSLMRHLNAQDVIEPAGLTLQTATDGCTRPTRLWRAVHQQGGAAAA